MFLDELCAARRVVGGIHTDTRQFAEEPLALRERLRVRIDARDLLDRRARQGEQMVLDRQFHLSDDRKVVLDQQVVIPVDAAADRVLDGQDPVRRPGGRNRLEHLVERLAREHVGVVAVTERRGLAVGPGLPLVGDAHSPATLQQRLLITQTS